MKKILIINHAGGSPYHGPNMRWYNLGLALKKENIEVSIVSSSYFHKYYSMPDSPSQLHVEVIDGLRYNWVKTRKYCVGSFFQIFNQFEFVIKCYIHKNKIMEFKPDIVFATSPHPFVFLPANSIAKKLNIPVIYEVRDLWPELLIQLSSKLKFHPYIWLLRLMERYAIRTADAVVSVKEGDYQYFESFYNKKLKKFLFIPNGLFKEGIRFSPLKPDFKKYREKYKFLIVYTGAISTYYDIDKIAILAEGLNANHDVGLVMVGDGNRSLQLKQLISNKELKNIHIIPSREKSEINTIIEASDACYLTLTELDINKNGISCNKIYDYMFFSKPIIGHYEASEFDPILLSGCGVVAGAGNEDILIENILQWKNSSSSAVRLGLLGKEFFEENYEFSVVAKKLKNQLFDK